MRPHINTSSNNRTLHWLQQPARCPTTAMWTCRMLTAILCQTSATHPSQCRQTSLATPGRRSKTSCVHTASMSSSLKAAKLCYWILNCRSGRRFMRCMSKVSQQPACGMHKQHRLRASSVPATSSIYCGGCVAVCQVVLILPLKRRWISIQSEVSCPHHKAARLLAQQSNCAAASHAFTSNFMVLFRFGLHCMKCIQP